MKSPAEIFISGPGEVLDEFMIELGTFVLAYAEVEAVLKQVAAEQFGMSWKRGKALFHDMRLRPIIDKIRRVSQARGTSLYPMLDAALVQLAHINDMRDKLLHQGFDHLGKGQFITTNRGLAPSKKLIKTLPVNSMMLSHMTGDLLQIGAYLVLFGMPNSYPLDKETHGRLTPENTRTKTWRYKPPQPVPERAKSRGTLQRPLRPQKASRK